MSSGPRPEASGQASSLPGRIVKTRPVVQELQVAYSSNTLSFWARPSPGTFFNLRLGPRHSYSS